MADTLKKQFKDNRLFTFKTKKNADQCTLAEYFAAGKSPMSPKHTLQLFTDIFNALSLMHQAGFVHQGICSDNILISETKAGNLQASLQHFEMSIDLQSTNFNIHDENTLALAMNFYESPAVFWGHINPMNQQIEEIKDGKFHFFHPPLKSAYFSSQEGNHGIRKSLIDFGVNLKKWCHQKTLFLLNPSPANDMWAAGILLAECLTGVHPPLLNLETALNHDVHKQYPTPFIPLVEKLLAWDEHERIDAEQALETIKSLKSEFQRKVS